MSDDEPANAPERVWLAPDLGDDWSILKVGDAIYWEGIDRHHPDDCETEYVRADIAAARIRELEATVERLRVANIQMQFALGYPMPDEMEHYIIPSNPWKCGRCEARAAQTERQQGGRRED